MSQESVALPPVAVEAEAEEVGRVGETKPALITLVKWISESIQGSDESRQRAKLVETLGKSTMFRELTKSQVEAIADACVPIQFTKGQILQHQNQPQVKAFVIVEGECVRQRIVDDHVHIVGTLGDANSSRTVGMLHLLRGEPSFATLKATSNGLAYQIQAKDMRLLFEQQPEVALGAIHSLCREVIEMSEDNLGQTPLFMSQNKSLPWFAISVASAIESFYRSAMNSFINSVLTGKPRAALFPNMHIQIPVRVVYINGFKGIRYFVDSTYTDLADKFDHPQLVAMGLATVPGVVMTPISSLLEASNAGHLNPESLAIRWTRGLVPRCAREVVFGMGINQLTDYYEERMTLFKDPVYKGLAASFVSGLVAGYISHVPHSMSALKLVYPKKTYSELFTSYASHWDKRIPAHWNNRRLAVNAMACLLPKGCLVRSTQIAGSFIIINSAIDLLKHIKVDIRNEQ
ncbi:hypothetical protein BASA81_002242 [Batrachochytrium salamandrivorans]|nr:hypothetical protein BASA81_002242 [Batrachochytrium salamandrivorans]